MPAPMHSFQMTDSEDEFARGLTAEVAAERRIRTTESSSRKCCRLWTTAAGNLAAATLTLVLFSAPYCHGLPVDDMRLSNHWWHIPCGTEGEMTMRAAGIGGQVKSWRRTETQLHLAQNHFNSLALRKMYSEVVDVLEEAYDYRWLPENQVEWFKRKFGKFGSNIQEVGPKVLLALHVALQKFAVTLDKLYRHQHEEEHSHFGKQRSAVLLGLCLELRKLLCEVEESLSTAGGELPNPPLGSSDVIPQNKWDTRPDKTALLVQDWGVLRTYGSFLVDWRTIVDKLLESASGSKRRKLKNKGQNRNGRRNRGRGRGGRRGVASSSQETKAGEESGTVESAEERQRAARRSSGEAGERRVRGSRGGRAGKKDRRRPERRREGERRAPERPVVMEQQ